MAANPDVLVGARLKISFKVELLLQCLLTKVVRESAKKSSPTRSQATKALAPSPLELSGHRNFHIEILKLRLSFIKFKLDPGCFSRVGSGSNLS